MNHKTDRLTALVEPWQGNDLQPHYLAFFECFNRRRFFEAHEVLEALWLSQRGGARDRFYKGLIQLAGAFVHVQKNRPEPAAALLRLARGNLHGYLPVYDRLDVQALLGRINGWLRLLQEGQRNELLAPVPELILELLPP